MSFCRRKLLTCCKQTVVLSCFRNKEYRDEVTPGSALSYYVITAELSAWAGSMEPNRIFWSGPVGAPKE